MKSEDLFEPFIEEDEFFIEKNTKLKKEVKKNEYGDLEISKLKLLRLSIIDQRVELSKIQNEEEMFILEQKNLYNSIEKKLISKSVEESYTKTFEVSLEDLSLRYNRVIPPFIKNIVKCLLNDKFSSILETDIDLKQYKIVVDEEYPSTKKLIELIESESTLHMEDYKPEELMKLIKVFISKLPIKLIPGNVTPLMKEKFSNSLFKLTMKELKDLNVKKAEFEKIFKLIPTSHEAFLFYLINFFFNIISAELCSYEEISMMFADVIFDGFDSILEQIEIFTFMLKNFSQNKAFQDNSKAYQLSVIRQVANRPHLYYASCIDSLCLIPLFTDEKLNDQKKFTNLKSETILNKDSSLKAASVNKLIQLLTTTNG
jgi:hypothetical protein